MSMEPSTSAKCILYTSKGRLDVELWASEVPGASKAFLQQCQDDIVSRLTKVRSDGTVTMGRTHHAHIDPEHHARIRTCSRGTVGWDGRTGEWFVATQDCPWDEDRTLIGRVVGESNYVLRRIVDESELDTSGAFIYPPLVEEAEVTVPYFDLKHKVEQRKQEPVKRPRRAAKVKLDFDSEEEEEDDIVPLKKMRMPPSISAVTPAEQIDVQGTEEEKEEGGQQEQQEQQQQQEGQEQEQEQEQPPLHELSQREQQTLLLLAQFQERIKGKNILSSQ